MASKYTCRPVRDGKKPGPKNVRVKAHKRSTPRESGRSC